MHKKLDKILFYSVSKECFADYVDVDTVVMSMLFDRNLKSPDAESAVQIPNRAKTKSHNPFDASKAKMKDRAESPDRPAPQQCWDPVLPVESRIVDGSALSLVRQQVPARLSPHPTPLFLASVASAQTFGFCPNHCPHLQIPPLSFVAK